MSRSRRDLEHRENWVYRVYDDRDRLLYIGCSVNVEARLMNHRARSEWFALAVRVEVERFPSRTEALAVEEQAIEDEGPQFNTKRRPVPLPPIVERGTVPRISQGERTA